MSGLTRRQTKHMLGRRGGKLKSYAARLERKLQRQMEAQRLIDQVEARKTARRKRSQGSHAGENLRRAAYAAPEPAPLAGVDGPTVD